MMKFNQNLQIIRPTLPIEQQAFRNRYHRNWGTLYPVFSKQRQPVFVFPSIYYICNFASYLIVLIVLGRISGNIDFMIEFGLIGLILISYLWANATSHGIASCALPLLNQDSFRHYRGFCQNCRVFNGQLGVLMQKNEQQNNQLQKNLKNRQIVNHCKECKVCYYSLYYHSKFLGVCITKKNYPPFFLFYTLSLIAIVRILVVTFIL